MPRAFPATTCPLQDMAAWRHTKLWASVWSNETRWRSGTSHEDRSLPPDVEERTAELYRRWCGLDTIDALLLLHVCNGGTCENFGAYLLRVHGAIERANVERDNYRATAWAKWKRLVARFAPYMRGERLQSWDDGHGGAIRKERERDERQPDLFDFMGGE